MLDIDLLGLGHELAGDLLAIGGDDLAERAAREGILDAVLDRVAQQPAGALLVTTGRLEVQRRHRECAT